MNDSIFTYENLPSIIDISALSVKTNEADVKKLAEAANKYNCIAAFVLPCHMDYLRKCLGEDTKVIMGAPIGFPTGADLTDDKVFQVNELKKRGCTEFDMVMCVSKLKSSDLDYVREDIRRVKEAAMPYPLKVILEVTYLTDDEIAIGSDIVAQSGAEYVKTGTGYSPMPTEVRHVEIMKKAIGDSIKIKVAGGVRTIDDIKAFCKTGASRLGMGMAAAIDVMEGLK